MKSYPSIVRRTLDGISDVVEFIVRERDKDVRDWNNLQNIFVNGRKVNKVPSSSVDIDPNSDRIGDINYDASYFYYITLSGGNAVWRRIASSTW